MSGCFCHRSCQILASLDEPIDIKKRTIRNYSCNCKGSRAKDGEIERLRKELEKVKEENEKLEVKLNELMNHHLNDTDKIFVTTSEVIMNRAFIV